MQDRLKYLEYFYIFQIKVYVISLNLFNNFKVFSLLIAIFPFTWPYALPSHEILIKMIKIHF